jgi:hypothetical protein
MAHGINDKQDKAKGNCENRIFLMASTLYPESKGVWPWKRPLSKYTLSLHKKDGKKGERDAIPIE